MLGRRLILLAGVVASTTTASVWVACSPTSPQLVAPDAGLPLFDAAALPPLVYDGGPEPVRVTVASLAGPVNGATVVFHDTNGTVIGSTTTDAEGHAERLLPAGTAVSILTGNSVDTFAVTTYLAVEPGDLLFVYDPSVVPTNNTVTLQSFPGSPPNTAVGYNAYLGNYSGGFNTTPPVMFYPNNRELNPAAQFPILVEAVDQLSTILGYSYVKNQKLDLEAGANVFMDAATWTTTPEAAWTVDIANPSLVSNPTIVFSEIAGYVPLTNASFAQTDGDGGFLPTAFNTHPGYGDFVQTEARASTNGTFGTTFTVVATRSPAPAKDQTLTMDMSQMPPAINTVTPDLTTNPAQPSVTFQPDKPIASPIGTFVEYVWQNYDADADIYTNNTWTIVAPPTLTTIAAPPLPSSAVAWTPDTSANPSVTITVMSGDGIASYAAFRRVAGVMPPPSYNNLAQTIAPLLPFDGTLTLSAVGPYQD